MDAAIDDLEKLLTPAPPEQIEAWLAELSVIAPKRASDAFEESLRLTAYTSRLGAYPADVARYATIVRRWQFWPSWAELEAACEEAVRPRLQMIAALRRGPRQQGGFVSYQPERRDRVTPEAAGKIISEIYGSMLGES